MTEETGILSSCGAGMSEANETLLVGLQIEARPMHEHYAVLAEITEDGAKTILAALSTLPQAGAPAQPDAGDLREAVEAEFKAFANGVVYRSERAMLRAISRHTDAILALTAKGEGR